MKIKSIMAKNFAKFTEISVNVDPSLTIFVGPNSAGKTSLGLNAVWFTLQGLAQTGQNVLHAERYRFIGKEGKTAQCQIELHDDKEDTTHTITRKLLKDSVQLEIKSSDGKQRGQEFLDSIFSSIFFDLRKFSRMTGKEQALALGIDTSGFEAQRRILFQGRHDIGVDLKRLKGVAESSRGAEKVEAVSTSGLIEKLRRRRKINGQNKDEATKLEILADRLDQRAENVQQLKTEIEEAQKELAILEKHFEETKQQERAQAKIVDGLKSADEKEVEVQISQAEETNAKARGYKDSLINQEVYEIEQAKYDAETKNIQELDTRLAQYLHNQKLPFSNVTIEDGEFRLSGRPFCEPYFSTGELLRFTAKLADKIMAKMEQKLEYVWIPGVQDIDEKNRHELFDELIKRGWQIVAELVSTKKVKKQHCILLKECQVVDSYDNEKSGEELE